MATDGQHGDLGAVELGDELHVAKDGRIACVVEDRAIGDGEHKAGGYPDVVSSLFILRAGGVLGLDHRGGYVVELHGSAEVHADGLGNALGCHIVCQFIAGHDRRAMLGGDGSHVRDVVAMAVGEQDVVDLGGQNEILGVTWGCGR